LNPEEEIFQLLEEHDFVLFRDTNHYVYKHHASGRCWTVPKTPSDHRSYPNNLSALRHFLGIIRPARIGERREKKLKSKAAPTYNWTSDHKAPAVGRTLADQLKTVLGQ
jgi:hypothetical protein